MHDKNKDTKSFTELFWLYCQEPDLEPNRKSMVELFCKNNLLVVGLGRLFLIWKKE